MKKTLFIDRDGTILAEPANGFAASLEEFSFLQGVITALSKIVRETDYELVMYTIQDGPGTDIFQEELFWPTHNKMLQILKNEGVIFAGYSSTAPGLKTTHPPGKRELPYRPDTLPGGLTWNPPMSLATG